MFDLSSLVSVSALVVAARRCVFGIFEYVLPSGVWGRRGFGAAISPGVAHGTGARGASWSGAGLAMASATEGYDEGDLNMKAVEVCIQ